MDGDALLPKVDARRGRTLPTRGRNEGSEAHMSPIDISAVDHEDEMALLHVMSGLSSRKVRRRIEMTVAKKPREKIPKSTNFWGPLMRSFQSAGKGKAKIIISVPIFAPA